MKSPDFTGDSTDLKAERILVYQRENGGWPQYHGDKVDYSEDLSSEKMQEILADKSKDDTTIDDQTTTGEIKDLLKAYQKTGNNNYLKAAEAGLEYLLAAQNDKGGWPQTYPRSNSYHKHITFNDEAMIDVMWILRGVALSESLYEPLSMNYKKQAEEGLERGVECILRTQYVQNGQKTVWCAQHDSQTLLPAAARAFEPASLSGKESVGIVLFLESLPNRTDEINRSITAAKEWFSQVVIEDKAVRRFKNNGKNDSEMISAPGRQLWARFYSLDDNQPIYMGRDRVLKRNLNEIEQERRGGYAYLGTWPQKLKP
ncbi:pectate lyase [Jiulongibacter sp. NS-SX5]|uniref:pectate lyase n=1 Tax=Jiulongibacter sp. NS-SX5 TaxID=3463854 RepID=UPI0040588CBE